MPAAFLALSAWLRGRNLGVWESFFNFAAQSRVMNNLEFLTESHREDMARLNGRIAQRLQCANPMMTNIIMSLLRTKGKQLRPLLLIMCAKLFGSVDDNVIAAAAAVELIHNASLIHDDVVDNSMTRRGVPTVNAVWDNHIAVLVGDFFTSSSMQEAIATGDIRIIDALCELGRMLSLGEIDQIYNARQHTLDEENYYRIIDYKTSSLFVASARMGCIAAGATPEQTEALAHFALLFGRCFQLRDDVFDYYSSDLVGKPTGNDLREGKVTLPLLKALDTDSAESAALRGLLEKDSLDDAEICRLCAFARENGGIEKTYATMEQLRREACASLDALGIDSPVIEQLRSLFSFIIERKF